MKITKYEHACLLVEELGQHLIVDPGMFAASLPTDIKEVVAIVVTHMHGDHLSMELLKELVAANPDVTIFAPQDALDEMKDLDVKKELAEPGVSHTAGSFALDFYGKDHAIIYESVPCQNVGVMINKTLYYPGDSFTEPKEAIKILALPSGAPWMKISEAVDYLKATMPGSAFPTHNSVYSDAGNMFANNWLEEKAKALGAAWSYLLPGDSVDV